MSGLDSADGLVEKLEKAGYTVTDPITFQEVVLTIAGQADEIVRGRMKVYGDPEESWERIADQVSQHRNVTLTGEDVLWTLFHMKLERDKHSPENRDHLRDACGYLALIDILRQRKAERKKPPEAWVPHQEAVDALFKTPPKLWDKIHYGLDFKTTGEVYYKGPCDGLFTAVCAGVYTELKLSDEGKTWRRA